MRQILALLTLVVLCGCGSSIKPSKCLEGSSQYEYEDANDGSRLFVIKRESTVKLAFDRTGALPSESQFDVILKDGVISMASLRVPINRESRNSQLMGDCLFREDSKILPSRLSEANYFVYCLGKFDSADQEVEISGKRGILRWSTVKDDEIYSDYRLISKGGLFEGCAIN